MGRFEGNIAIVTGAGQGIGKAVALAFANEGAHVVVADVLADLATQVAEEISAHGRRALGVRTDVSDGTDVGLLVQETLETFHKIDILVNNAGIAIPGLSEQITETDWDRTFNVNLKGQFLCSQAVGKQMIAQNQGKIVNVASLGAHRAIPKQAAYCASKAGVVMLTQVLAVEWARHKINVNAVSPGLTITAMSDKVLRGYSSFSALTRSIPLKRANVPADAAKAVLFLASSDADNITGQVLLVDGGRSAIDAGYVEALDE